MSKPILGGWELMSLWVLLNEISAALFSTPITTVFMAAVGSSLTYAYDLDGAAPMSRKRMYFLAVANTAFATAAVVVLPKWLGWEWASNAMQGSLALLFAASARIVIPTIFGLAKEIVKKWFRLEQYNTAAASKETNTSEGKTDDI
jgi:hypothetical protein